MSHRADLKQLFGIQVRLKDLDPGDTFYIAEETKSGRYVPFCNCKGVLIRVSGDDAEIDTLNGCKLHSGIIIHESLVSSDLHVFPLKESVRLKESDNGQ